MNYENVIQIARKSELIGLKDFIAPKGSIVRFAELVVAAEREACAKVCDELAWSDPPKNFAENCAAAIRARGNK